MTESGGQNPLGLSVVMPNYNHGRFITRAVEAVFLQSRPPDEFLIVDDASTDDSVAVIQGLQKRFPAIRLLRNAGNLGMHRTFNYGVEQVSGDYVHGAAADDYVLPGFYEQAMALAERHRGVGIVSGHQVAIDLSGDRKAPGQTLPLAGYAFTSPEVYCRDFMSRDLRAVPYSAASLYCRRTYLDLAWHRAELGHLSDLFTNHVLALKSGLCYLPIECAAWCENPEGLCRSEEANPKVMFDSIARAAWLMRAPPYCDLFPGEYVARWESDWRAWQLRSAVYLNKMRWIERFDRRIQWLNARGYVLRRLSYLLYEVEKLAVPRAVAVTGRKWTRYVPDVSGMQASRR